MFYCFLVLIRSFYIYGYYVIDYSMIWIRWERFLLKYVGGILRGYWIYYIFVYKYDYSGYVRNIMVGFDVLEMIIIGFKLNIDYRVWVKVFMFKGEGGDENRVYIRISKLFFCSK